MTDIRERLTAAGLGVTELKWGEPFDGVFAATSSTGEYFAATMSLGDHIWFVREFGRMSGDLHKEISLDAAKAAAQADYEARILSALALSNSTGEAE